MKKILSFTIFFSLFFSFIFLAGFNDLALEKDKKRDFSFRKCKSCKITN